MESLWHGFLPKCQSCGCPKGEPGILEQPNVCVDDEERSTAVSYPHLFIGE